MSSQLKDPSEISRDAELETTDLEKRVIKGYIDETLSHYEAAEMLGLSRFEFDGFLKKREIFDHAYDMDDLQADLKAIRGF